MNARCAVPTFISGLLQERGLDPSWLMLEITESALLKDVAYATAPESSPGA